MTRAGKCQGVRPGQCLGWSAERRSETAQRGGAKRRREAGRNGAERRGETSDDSCTSPSMSRAKTKAMSEVNVRGQCARSIAREGGAGAAAELRACQCSTKCSTLGQDQVIVQSRALRCGVEMLRSRPSSKCPGFTKALTYIIGKSGNLEHTCSSARTMRGSAASWASPPSSPAARIELETSARSSYLGFRI